MLYIWVALYLTYLRNRAEGVRCIAVHHELSYEPALLRDSEDCSCRRPLNNTTGSNPSGVQEIRLFIHQLHTLRRLRICTCWKQVASTVVALLFKKKQVASTNLAAQRQEHVNFPWQELVSSMPWPWSMPPWRT
jgi:hypothetical protein